MLDDTLIQILFLAICHILAIIVFVLIFTFIITRLLRKKNNPYRREKIIAIVITCILYNVTIQNVIYRPISMLIGNTQKLFFLYSKYCDAETLRESNQISDIQTFKENNPLSDISVIDIFQSLPIARLLTSISIAILLYFIIKYINYKNERQQDNPSYTKNTSLLFNYIIILTLTLSVFLIISVCITIPHLSEISKPTIFTKERLDSSLNNNVSNKDSFDVTVSDSVFPSTFTLDIIINGDTSLNRQFSNLQEAQKNEINQLITSSARNLKNLNDSRNSLVESVKEFTQTYNKKTGDLRRRLLLNFENTTRSLLVDKASTFEFAVNRFYDYSNNLKTNFAETQNYISYLDNANQNQLNFLVSDIRNSIKRLYQDSTHFLISANNLTTVSFTKYLAFEANLNDYASIPSLENNWEGFFGFMTNWLVKTQSSDLVILMGMFGFGLLGASLFSFSKTDVSKSFIETFKTQPLILNFGSVITRGFGAALVVYLAAKGGLAIFSAGTSTDANGYILLLSCFVGAVYSEKVWNKISDSFYGQGNNNGEGNNDGGGNNNEGNGVQDDKINNADNGKNSNINAENGEEKTNEEIMQEMISAQNLHQLTLSDSIDASDPNNSQTT